MRKPRTSRTAATLLASLLAVGLAGTPAYADEPEPTATPTASPDQPPEPPPEPSPEPSPEPPAEPSTEPAPEETPAPPAPAPAAPAEPSAVSEAAPTESSASAQAAPVPAEDLTLNNPTGTADVPLDVAMPTVDCPRLGLAFGCATLLDTTPLLSLIQSVATGCTASSGACTSAVRAATGAVALAARCADALTSESGLPLALAAGDDSAGDALDCRAAANLALTTAATARRTVESCVHGYTALCAAVFDAAALALDRANGCLAATLSETGLRFTVDDGTDPVCRDAIHALQGVADGLVDLLTSCTDGHGGCGTVLTTADYVRVALPGCVGPLVVNVTGVQVPLPSKESDDPLRCWMAVDQANHLLDVWLHRLPEQPYRLDPSDGCSVYLAAPVEAGSPNVLIPPCDVPEDPTPVVTADGAAVHGAAMLEEGRSCEESKDFVVDKVYPAHFETVDSTTFYNENVKKASMEYQQALSTRVGVSIGAKAEVDAGVIFAKVKAAVESRLDWQHEWQMTYTYRADVPARTAVSIYVGSSRAVVDGRYTFRGDDCTYKVVTVRFRGPFERSAVTRQRPYYG